MASPKMSAAAATLHKIRKSLQKVQRRFQKILRREERLHKQRQALRRKKSALLRREQDAIVELVIDELHIDEVWGPKEDTATNTKRKSNSPKAAK